jgi:hypothetical protein|tara:strand:+ start:4136 stop:4894 length:759 start_codon:yes stop_codon:yes gene_type:complete
MFKKILPAITGAIGFAVAGPVGASIGAGLGSAVRGDNPANIATSALMGFGLGSFGASAGLVGGQGLGALGSSAKTMVSPPIANAPGGLGGKVATTPGVFQRGVEAFKGMSGLTKGALGLGAIAALSSMDEEEEESNISPSPEAGSIAPLDMRSAPVTYFDESTGEYGASAPTYRSLKDGGFPRKTGQIDGPGTEKSDDIPAMLSDGEFVMTAKAVRGLGALKGAKKNDKIEQRRQGAKTMYEMMHKLEKKVA